MTNKLTPLVFGVAGAVWALDQGTKLWAISRLENSAPVQVIGEWLQLTFLRNPGAAFSLGSGSTVLFTLVAVAVVVVIVRMASTLRHPMWALALGLLLGGALGNLTDRLIRPPGFPNGHVVDFISVKYFAVFNVADIAITSAALLMVLLAVRGVDAKTAPHQPVEGTV